MKDQSAIEWLSCVQQGSYALLTSELAAYFSETTPEGIPQRITISEINVLS